VLIPTKDYLYLAKASGINFIVFALAKTEKKQEMKGRIGDIQQKVMDLSKNIGIKAENTRFIQISVIEDYFERNLLETLDFVSRPVGDEYKPLRILIDDNYKLVHGNFLGLCITGFVISGVVSVGATICVEQAGFTGKAKEIMKCGEKVKKAMAGDWVDITLSSPVGEFYDISRGFIASSDNFGILTGQKLRLRGITNEIQIPILKKQELLLFIGSIKTPVTVLKVLRQVNGKDVKINPRCLKGKCIGDIEVFCHNKIALEKSKNLQKLGRCLLLSQNKLIFTGMIIEILS
jgi:translation elongation factor EF-1alpha